MIKKIFKKIKHFKVVVFDILKNIFLDTKLIYIVENVEWVIKWEGKQLIEKINLNTDIKSDLRITSFGARNKILHFGSVNTIFNKNNSLKKIHKSNKVVITWYHVLPGDEKTRFIPEINNFVSFVHTACKEMKKKLVNLGFDEKKIVIISLGMDLKMFKKKNVKEINFFKEKIGLPQDKMIIGSFQKDGNGWGEGLEPKLIKGPDIFCDAIAEIANKIDVHVLLTGPSRGYVKRRLDKMNVDYTHRYLDSYPDIVSYFNALDLYLIASRVEGGPKALQECWATGVPVVSTKVGMVPDIGRHRENVLLVDVEDTDSIIRHSLEILRDKELKNSLIKNGLEEISKYSWDQVSYEYVNNIYNKLI